ncbi:pantothenate kinase [Cystoisospora suis]|uniref:Pantothenate kinase n=1 Tax=Cystoisospora suis TaxID=483139 RepID=A0A2C6KLR6_9APIC|nr:pantothenate kinase [Cystoisospora suis]
MGSALGVDVTACTVRVVSTARHSFISSAIVSSSSLQDSPSSSSSSIPSSRDNRHSSSSEKPFFSSSSPSSSLLQPSSTSSRRAMKSKRNLRRSHLSSSSSRLSFHELFHKIYKAPLRPSLLNTFSSSSSEKDSLLSRHEVEDSNEAREEEEKEERKNSKKEGEREREEESLPCKVDSVHSRQTVEKCECVRQVSVSNLSSSSSFSSKERWRRGEERRRRLKAMRRKKKKEKRVYWYERRVSMSLRNGKTPKQGHDSPSSSSSRPVSSSTFLSPSCSSSCRTRGQERCRRKARREREAPLDKEKQKEAINDRRRLHKCEVNEQEQEEKEKQILHRGKKERGPKLKKKKKEEEEDYFVFLKQEEFIQNVLKINFPSVQVQKLEKILNSSLVASHADRRRRTRRDTEGKRKKEQKNTEEAGKEERSSSSRSQLSSSSSSLSSFRYVLYFWHLDWGSIHTLISLALPYISRNCRISITGNGCTKLQRIFQHELHLYTLPSWSQKKTPSSSSSPPHFLVEASPLSTKITTRAPVSSSSSSWSEKSKQSADVSVPSLERDVCPLRGHEEEKEEEEQGSSLSSSEKNRAKSLKRREGEKNGACSTEEKSLGLDGTETDYNAMREKVSSSLSFLWKGVKKQEEEEEKGESVEERQEKVKSLILTFERETGCIIEALHFLIKYFPSTIFRYEGTRRAVNEAGGGEGRPPDDFYECPLTDEEKDSFYPYLLVNLKAGVSFHKVFAAPSSIHPFWGYRQRHLSSLLPTHSHQNPRRYDQFLPLLSKKPSSAPFSSSSSSFSSSSSSFSSSPSRCHLSSSLSQGEGCPLNVGEERERERRDSFFPPIFTSQRIGGSTIGGATFMGLCRLILPTSLSPKHLLELAARGDNTRCDMLVKDIYGGSYQAIGLKSSTIASTFGKLQHIPLKYLQGYALENNSAEEEEEEGEGKEKEDMKIKKCSSAKRRRRKRRSSPSFTNPGISSPRGTPHLPSSSSSSPSYRCPHFHCRDGEMLYCNFSCNCFSSPPSSSSSPSCVCRVGDLNVEPSYPCCSCSCVSCDGPFSSSSPFCSWAETVGETQEGLDSTCACGREECRKKEFETLEGWRGKKGRERRRRSSLSSWLREDVKDGDDDDGRRSRRRKERVARCCSPFCFLEVLSDSVLVEERRTDLRRRIGVAEEEGEEEKEKKDDGEDLLTVCSSCCCCSSSTGEKEKKKEEEKKKMKLVSKGFSSSSSPLCRCCNCEMSPSTASPACSHLWREEEEEEDERKWMFMTETESSIGDSFPSFDEDEDELDEEDQEILEREETRDREVHIKYVQKMSREFKEAEGYENVREDDIKKKAICLVKETATTTTTTTPGNREKREKENKAKYDLYHPHHTAHGGVYERPSEADIVRSLLTLMSFNVAQQAYLHAALHGLKRIALVGFLLNVPGLLASFQHSVRFWSGNDVKVFFCSLSPFLGALGASVLNDEFLFSQKDHQTKSALSSSSSSFSFFHPSPSSPMSSSLSSKKSSLLQPRLSSPHQRHLNTLLPSRDARRLLLYDASLDRLSSALPRYQHSSTQSPSERERRRFSSNTEGKMRRGEAQSIKAKSTWDFLSDRHHNRHVNERRDRIEEKGLSSALFLSESRSRYFCRKARSLSPKDERRRDCVSRVSTMSDGDGRYIGRWRRDGREEREEKRSRDLRDQDREGRRDTSENTKAEEDGFRRGSDGGPSMTEHILQSSNMRRNRLERWKRRREGHEDIEEDERSLVFSSPSSSSSHCPPPSVYFSGPSSSTAPDGDSSSFSPQRLQDNRFLRRSVFFPRSEPFKPPPPHALLTPDVQPPFSPSTPTSFLPSSIFSPSLGPEVFLHRVTAQDRREQEEEESDDLRDVFEGRSGRRRGYRRERRRQGDLYGKEEDEEEEENDDEDRRSDSSCSCSPFLLPTPLLLPPPPPFLPPLASCFHKKHAGASSVFTPGDGGGEGEKPEERRNAEKKKKFEEVLPNKGFLFQPCQPYMQRIQEEEEE